MSETRDRPSLPDALDAPRDQLQPDHRMLDRLRYHPMQNDELDEDGLPPSRSQRRRDAWDVLELAEKLVALTPAQLKEVPLDEAIFDAVKMAQKITSHIAHKRQVHYLAKLMRKQADLDAIRITVDKPLEVRRKETAELHLMERWRERLVTEGDAAVGELVTHYPEIDRHRLRQLIRQAAIERRDNRGPSAQRAIFQMLKGQIQGVGMGDPEAPESGEESDDELRDPP